MLTHFSHINLHLFFKPIDTQVSFWTTAHNVLCSWDSLLHTSLLCFLIPLHKVILFFPAYIISVPTGPGPDLSFDSYFFDSHLWLVTCSFHTLSFILPVVTSSPIVLALDTWFRRFLWSNKIVHLPVLLGLAKIQNCLHLP